VYGKFPLKLQPDCSVYTTGNKTEDDLDLSCVDFVIEMKSAREADPFVVTTLPNTSSGNEPNHACRYVPSDSESESCSQRDNLGWMTAYATAIMGTQYRTHTFSVFHCR
jgi:hypothetical protein